MICGFTLALRLTTNAQPTGIWEIGQRLVDVPLYTCYNPG
jgi:hypothetical protein